MTKLPELLTSKQVACILGVNEYTLANWRATKKYPLPFIKIGRLVRYKIADLNNFVAGEVPKLKLKPIERPVITQKGFDGHWHDLVWENGKLVPQDKNKEH